MTFSNQGQDVFVASGNIVTRKIAGETILVPISGNLANMQRIYTINELGECIWQKLDGKHTVDAIRKELMDAYEVDEALLEADIHEFIDKLRRDGLIEKV
jgi:hypothetical protein